MSLGRFCSWKISRMLMQVPTPGRLRMTCLYHIASCMDGLVVGTGNKVEDFGVGFFTKWEMEEWLSPIGDLFKSEVQDLALSLGIDEGAFAGSDGQVIGRMEGPMRISFQMSYGTWRSA